MENLDQREPTPQDIVAIFHASFHPTKGNVVDWCLKASDDLCLDGVEFSTLPSGLHLVDRDVVYFTKDCHSGVCVFRRRRTTEHGQRGFRLSSLGILLVKSTRPRPWRHVDALKRLVDGVYSSLETRGLLEPMEADWEPARMFFEERRVLRVDLGGAGDWHGWSHELDNPDIQYSLSNPTLHLPHLLRILGPSALTLYKHVLGRRRILIYTLPPVEAACVLCQVAADIVFEAQLEPTLLTTSAGMEDPSSWSHTRLKGKSKEGIKVLGMVTLSDLDKMHHEGKTGLGWIACTTDAIFLEKPSYYDLVIDLTTSTPSRTSRPTLYLSKPIHQPTPKGPTHRLSLVRFTWSDVKLWNELDRILQLEGNHSLYDCCQLSAELDPKTKPPLSHWTDAWQLYEDVCLICAGLWIGSWRGNSPTSYSTDNGSISNWGRVRLDGDDDLSMGGAYMRNLGQGIEGRPSGGSLPNLKGMRKSGAMSLNGHSTEPSSASTTGSQRRVVSTSTRLTSASMPRLSGPGDAAAEEDGVNHEQALHERRERQVLTTLALLQTFHANTCFQLSRLASLIPSSSSGSSSSSLDGEVISITPKDIMSFELGPLSSVDGRYLEWLAEEYGGGARFVVKRGWKDLFGVFFGFG